MSSFASVNLAYSAEQGTPLLPSDVLSHMGEIQHFDLSYNNLSSLNLFGNDPSLHKLESLVLDGNYLTEHTLFPFLPGLRFLSLNKNQITDMTVFIEWLKESAPNLEIVSVAHQRRKREVEEDERKTKEIRKLWIQEFPRLTLIDSTPVSKEERESAKAGRIEGKIFSGAKEKEDEKKKQKEEESAFVVPSRTKEPPAALVQTERAKGSLSSAAKATVQRRETIDQLEKDAHTLSSSMKEWRKNMREMQES